MSGTLSLNGTWQLTCAEGGHLAHPNHFIAPTLRGRALWDVPVPSPIHQVLQDKGLLDDPNVGLNSLRARWVEEMFWIYRHTFTVPAEAAQQQAWLTFDRLEFDAKILLNGEEIGHHQSAHRPFTLLVSGKLRAGENLLVVLISSGMHAYADKPSEQYHSGLIGCLTKRHWMRKPQYQVGWDWHARLTNVGILGDVTLDWHPGPRLRQLAVVAAPSADLATATITARAIVDTPGDAPVTAVLHAVIAETGQSVSRDVTLQPDESTAEAVITIEQPQLWWPRGHGEQFRYTVTVTLETPGDVQTASRKVGVRRVTFDQSAHPVTGQYFVLQINNRPIFCKGGNWVPPDMLYSTVTPARYRALVELARDANFTMLRIWGGGVYAEHPLCDLCDEMGLLIWHDFGFACAKYPGDDPDFAAEVRREITHVVRERAHHASLVVWCGGNEIEWGDWYWGYDRDAPTHPHYALMHHDIPKIVRAENPAAFYWPSSPFSPEQKHPNDPTVGDQHPWSVSIEGPGGADFHHYRTLVDRFPNEGGVLGASSPATLRQFLPEGERVMFSPSWEHHDNPFAAVDSKPGNLGHAYQTVELWLQRTPEAMDWETYAFASALLHAEGLQEYITNFRRRMYSSGSAIFWMYNDSWPVTHGWTIVDYYLRKKLAYHPVRRAFQPVTVVVAEEEGTVTVYGVNDTPHDWTGEVRYGLFTLAGAYPQDAVIPAHLPANASTPLATFPRAAWEAVGLTQSGAFAVLTRTGQHIAKHRLFLPRFHEMAFADPAITVTREEDRIVLTADAFAWGVCLDLDGEASPADNCFDLLPDVPYALPWPAELGTPEVKGVGNRLVIGTIV